MMERTLNSEELDEQLQSLRDLKLARDDVVAVISELGQLLGTPLALPESGIVGLVVDKQVELSLMFLEHLPGLVGVIALPQELTQRPEAMVRLLQANMSWSQTHGGCFALPPLLSQGPTLCRLFTLTERSAERLEEELAQFVDLGIAWRKNLEQSEAQAQTDLPPMTGIRV